MNFKALCRAAVVGWLAGMLTASAFAQSYVNYEGKQCRPICLSPDGTKLFAVNTPDARLSVYDVTKPLSPFLLAEIPVGVEPVSVNALDNDTVWVVNEVSDSISVVSVTSKAVTDTIYCKDEPQDVVFAGGKAFVSESRNNQVAVFNVTNRALLTNIVLLGANPRSLAVSTNGAKVYAAFALAGNGTTLLPVDFAPPQATNGTPPMNPSLPPPPEVALIVPADNPLVTNIIRYAVPSYGVVEIDVATMVTNRHFPRVGSVNFALAVNPGNGDLYVANTEARNLTHFEPALRGFFVTNRLARIALGSGGVTNFDLNPNFSPTNFTLANRTNALAQPTALAFGPGGTNVYVAVFGSDRVARVDAGSGAVLSRVELCPTATGSASDPRNKRGPRGLALKQGAALYVLNRIANTISIVDPVANTLLKEIPVGSYDPTPAVIKQGRGFLYDAKLSGNGTVSCASCHIDAEMDMLAWDLGDPTGTLVTNTTFFPGPGGVVSTNIIFHPMKGPMTTQTLRGLNGMDPLHWRGDRTNFTHFNGAFASLLGGSTLPAADMDAYRDFINTIVFQANPNRNLDRTLPTTFAGANPTAGFNAFVLTNYSGQLSCNACHLLPTGTARFIVPGVALTESQDFKVPHLRNLYQKTMLNRGTNVVSVSGFGYLHDGTFPTLFTFLSEPVFNLFATNSVTKSNLQSFLLCMDTGTAPAVGYARAAVGTNVTTASLSNDWSLLESQAAFQSNADFVVKGTVDGVRRGLLYVPASNYYKPDTTNLAPLTRTQLVAKVQAGDRLMLMGVPPGSGQRMGIDRNLNGVLDGDEPKPNLSVVPAGNKAVLTWPFTAVGYLPESASTLTSSWTALTNQIEIGGGLNFTTNTPNGNGFYRLRLP